MFRSASLFIGTSFTVAVFTIFATSNVDLIVGIPHKIYSMQRILIHIKSWSLCLMCPSAPRVCSEPGGQKPVLSLSLDRIDQSIKSVKSINHFWLFLLTVYGVHEETEWGGGTRQRRQCPGPVWSRVCQLLGQWILSNAIGQSGT